VIFFQKTTFWRAEYETNRHLSDDTERATTMIPNHGFLITGLFQDEQVKDARQPDKYPFLLLFFKRPSTPALPNSGGIDQQLSKGPTFDNR